MSARFELRLNVTNCSNVTLVTLSRLESSSQVTRTRLGRDSTALSDWLSWRLVVGITGYTVNLINNIVMIPTQQTSHLQPQPLTEPSELNFQRSSSP